MRRNFVIIAALIGSLGLCACTNSSHEPGFDSSITESDTVTVNGNYDTTKLSEFEYTPL